MACGPGHAWRATQRGTPPACDAPDQHSALTGEYARSGEIIVAVPSKNGRMTVTGRFLIDP